MRCCAVTLLLLLSSPVFSQNVPIQNTAITLKRAIEINHVTPRTVDDQFSADLFEHFFLHTDPDHLLFTQSDIASFQNFRTQLDDELSNRGWNFLKAVFPVLQKRMQQADSLAVAFLQQPLDFAASDKITPDFKNTRAAGEAEWKRRWQLYLKYEVWKGLAVQAAADATAKTVLSKEPQLRNKLRDRHHRQFQFLLANNAAGLQSKMEQAFLTSVAKCFDPHTDYFDAKARNEYKDALNTEGLYFGFSLADNDKDEVVITQLMPGGPAWKSGQLNKDDVFVQLQWEGKEPVDLSNATAQEVNDMIDEESDRRLSITVRKPNATLVTVTLRRERIENEDEFVKSFVLSGIRKIGYIYLPSFYTTWEMSSGSSCAADMAREIVKLKKEGIEGLILDVRFNGGGSLQEAIELTGIFIDEGPLGQFKTRDGKVVSLKDVNRGTVWDGPLILMVNGHSASASEMIAATLQDYNRALVVGSPTHGKATAQQFIPLDTLRRATNVNYTGQQATMLKITNGKLYRVTGKTAQGAGVQPDILLPDLYAALDDHENKMPFYLKPDTIKRNNYYQPLPPINFSEIKSRSEQRVASNTKFQFLATRAVKSAGFRNMPPVLTVESIVKHRESLKEWQLQDKQVKQPTTAYKPGRHSFDKMISEWSKEMDQRWLERLSSDPYVEECYFIISDLVNASKTKKQL